MKQINWDDLLEDLAETADVPEMWNTEMAIRFLVGLGKYRLAKAVLNGLYNHSLETNYITRGLAVFADSYFIYPPRKFEELLGTELMMPIEYKDVQQLDEGILTGQLFYFGRQEGRQFHVASCDIFIKRYPCVRKNKVVAEHDC